MCSPSARQMTGHLPGCSCCVARSPAATALAAVFRARATGAAPYFSRLLVLASPAGRSRCEGCPGPGRGDESPLSRLS